jgi:thiamine biosynthesis lipoprotein
MNASKNLSVRPGNVARQATAALGTLVDIAIDEADGVDAADVLGNTFGLVSELEQCLSAHRPDSELVRLCERAHRKPVPVSEPLREVLDSATLISRQSRGIFDVSLGQRMRSNLKWLRNDAVVFKRPMRLDLGGIAKGYVIDRVVHYLQSRGVTAGRVNAGGDFRIFGNTEQPISLRFEDGFRTIGRITHGAVAVSTASRHVDGRSGATVKTSLMVVVFAPSAVIADALTKIPVVCLKTMRRLAKIHDAEWRLFPSQVR